MKTIVSNLESLSAILDSISSLTELEPSESEYVVHLISELRRHSARLLRPKVTSEGGLALVTSSPSFGCQASRSLPPKAPPVSVDDYLHRSLEAISMTQFDEAKCILLDAIEDYPNNEDLLCNLALSCWELGEMEECASYYQAAMAASCPDNFSFEEWGEYPEHTFLRSMEGYALTLGQLGRHEEALEYFDLLYSLNPDRYVGCRYLAGEKHHLFGDVEKALDAYQDSPDEPCTYYNKGLAYFELGKKNLAAETFIYAFTLNPHIASKILRLPVVPKDTFAGYLGTAAYADEFLRHCSSIWFLPGRVDHIEFLGELFSNPLVQKHIYSFDTNGYYISPDGRHHIADSITHIPSFVNEARNIVLNFFSRVSA